MTRSVLSMLALAAMLAGCGAPTSRDPSAGRARHHQSADPPATAPVRRPSQRDPGRATARLTTWRLPYPVAREAAVRSTGSTVTVAGGLVPGDRTTGRAIVLDLLTGHASPLPPLSVPVHDTAAGLVAGRPTVVGGGNTSEQAVVQSMTAGRWQHLASLPTTRSDLAIAEWQRDAYVIGGYDGSSEPRTVLRLTPHGIPRPVGALTQGVRYAAIARIGSQVYVIGGEEAGQELDTIQNVDLATGRTRPAGHLAVPIGHAMAAPVGHRILVLGGRTTPTHQTDAMWWYDPKTGRVHSAGRLPRPLSDAAVTYHRGRVWLLGGEHPAITDRVVTVTVR